VRCPRYADGLRELPGIGEYTAGAVASIAFQAREPVVDGNVRACCHRPARCAALVSAGAVRRPRMNWFPKTDPAISTRR
jgi:A/G-specific adenine glycosylase